MSATNFLRGEGSLSRRGFLGLAGSVAAGLAAQAAGWGMAGCGPVPRTPAYFPTDTWRTATPEEQGIDSQGIAAMLEKVQRASPYMHSFLLVRNGFLVTEAYFAPIARELGHFLFSATKSVTSALVGIAIQEGTIRGVDQKILDFFPEMKAKSTSPNLELLTIEHLLTMTTGHVDAMSPTPYQESPVDWVEKFLADKTNTLIEPPGNTFLYTSGAAHTLSAVIQKATGKPLADYATEKLFAPLGIQEHTWLADQNGITFGNSWLRLRPIDMAKFGYLYLNGGAWASRQVIPKAWVERSTQKHIETRGTMFNRAEQYGYGYLWWRNGFGGFSAHGYGGQFIFVVPETSLIAVFTGGFEDGIFDTSYQLMKDYVIPAIKGKAGLAKNPAGQQALAGQVEQAGYPERKSVAPLPARAAQISKKIYQVAEGTQFVIDFDGSDEYTLTITYPVDSGQPTRNLRGGLDDVYRLNHSVDAVLGATILGVKGGWTDETTFVHREFVTDNVSNNIITCHVEEDRLRINLKDDFSGKSTYDVNIEAKLVE